MSLPFRAKPSLATALSGLLLGFSLTLFPGAPSEAHAQTRLRFANFPAAATFPCISMERWAEEIQKRTNGAVTIETFPGGTLLDAKNMVRGVVQGQADIGCISLAYHPGAYPFLSVFELPLGFTTAEEASAVMWDVHAAHSPKETSRIKVIGLFSSAPSQILSTKPLAGPEDINGMTLRSAGILADVTAALGASPISMPQSDAPEALQKGVVQGIFTSMDVLKDYNFAEACRFGLKVDMCVYPFMMFMNQKKWDSLTPDVQQAIMDLAREHSVWTGQYVDQHGLDALKWSEDTYGYVMNAITPEQHQELLGRMTPIIEAWVKQADGKGIDGQAILAEIEAARKNNQ